jgi:hypothetical protein
VPGKWRAQRIIEASVRLTQLLLELAPRHHPTVAASGRGRWRRRRAAVVRGGMREQARIHTVGVAVLGVERRPPILRGIMNRRKRERARAREREP